MRVVGLAVVDRVNLAVLVKRIPALIGRVVMAAVDGVMGRAQDDRRRLPAHEP